MTASTPPDVEVCPDADKLAHAVAERLVARLAELQSGGRIPSLVLTGGTIAEKVHRAVLAAYGTNAVDWSRVEIWFGDERFVPADDPARNALQAREAFLAALPLSPARVHEMPSSDGAYGDDVDAAAAGYAQELRRVLGEEPQFDVLMLGVGPDGHCASLFPGHAALDADGFTVGVHRSPKPPPSRISLTMEMLNRADEVWFLASGQGKAQAVHDAITGSDVAAIPAAGPKGAMRTVWLLDGEAASLLPPQSTG
ncbi:MAG TPA: 6-phosphogluconolactonase [Nocardioidaceae bacterium]|nr:6-phosphogluconolactonase [Nocardioidaceae bacterium]